MTATKADVRNAILENLGNLAAGETASSEDAATVETAIDREFARLDRRQALTWTAIRVEDEFVIPFAAIVAKSLLPKFPLGGEDLALVLRDAENGDRDFRRLLQRRTAGTRVKTEYF